jgi:virginiamycin B lyase
MSSMESEITATTAHAPAAAPKTLEVRGLGVAAAASDVPVWHTVPGALRKVSVGGAGYVWGVDSAGQVWQFQNAAWVMIPGMLGNVSVGADGTVWGVNKAGETFRRDGASWTMIPGAPMRQVSVGSASNVWGMSAVGLISQWTGNGWTEVPGRDIALTEVSVASDGTVWGVSGRNSGGSGLVFRRDGSTWTWIPMNTMIRQISVGSATNVWCVADGMMPMQWNGTWMEPLIGIGAFDSISAAADGSVWGVTSIGVQYRVKAAPLVIDRPRLLEPDLQRGEDADYGFRILNTAQGVTLSQITLTLLYDERSFSASGVTVTPGVIRYAPTLAYGQSAELTFRLTTALNARIGNYGIYGVNAAYTSTPDTQLVPLSGTGGWMAFQVVEPLIPR